ncbi:MAG: hypothetical protein R3E98_12045 [Gemmatimonadota bacterium]|nr:hypothetical protein [Gemmatimonadota bacterium]
MFFAAHSGIRYLTLLFGILALVYALFGMVTRRPYDKPMRILATAFAGTLHLQIVLGFAVLFSGRFYPGIYLHFLLMVLAAVVAQLPPSVMRRRPPEARSFVPHVVGTAIALVLVVVGILSIGRGVFQSTL